MPYICLARADIPDGTLQVTDLWPNTSQRNQSIDPPGQTRYFRRTRNTAVVVSSVTGLATAARSNEDMDGLSAYLVDRVEPGGLTAEAQTITVLAGLTAGTTITIDGPNGAPVVFTATAGGAIAANQEFNDVANAGSTILCASSLVLAINAAASLLLLEASIGGVASGEIITATNVGGTSATVTITADVRPGTNYLQTTLAEDSAGVEVTLGGSRMVRAAQTWTTTTLANAAAAIQNRVDGGQTLTLANITAALNGVVTGTELGGAAGSLSSGTVLDVLSILAGRSYKLPAGSAVLDTALLPVVVPNPGSLGSFTDSVQVFDSQMLQGEIRPVTPFRKLPNNHARSQVNNVTGGDTATPEYAGVRYSVDGDAIQASLLNGQLSRMQDGSVTLLPNNGVVFHGLEAFQPDGPVAPINNARLVTVYADDGNLL